MVTLRHPRAVAAGAALLAAAGLGIVLAEARGGEHYSARWPVGDVLTVVERGNHLDLAGIDPTTSQLLNLARLPVQIPPGTVPQTALINDGSGNVLAVVTGSDGFQATVVLVDHAAHTVRTVGTIADGRFPTWSNHQLIGYGPAGRISGYSYPRLTTSWTRQTPLQPVASDVNCTVGTLATNAAVARGQLAPTVVAPQAIPAGVACTPTRSAVSLSALLPPGADPHSPPPGNSVVVNDHTTQWLLQVGTHPQTVATDGRIIAVDVDGAAGHRKLELVDADRRALIRSVDLATVQRVTGAFVDGTRVVVIGERTIETIPISGGPARTTTMPGTAVAYQLATFGPAGNPAADSRQPADP